MPFTIDLHVHTKFSGDSDAEPDDVVMHAIEKKLNGIAFTEHYYYEASEYAEKLKEKYSAHIRIFRGVEISTMEGHCLVFGVNTDRLALKHSSAEELLRIVNTAGGVVIPSHPYRGFNSIGDLVTIINRFPALEGYNGCNMHAMNAKALETAKSLNLPYTGGSDAHSAREVGSCYTEFYKKVTEENFISLLQKGSYRGIDTRKVSRGLDFDAIFKKTPSGP